MWCVSARGDGSHLVRVVNNKRFSVLVSGGSGTSVIAKNTDGLSTRGSDLLSKKNQVVLSPGGSADFRIAPGVNTKIASQYDGLAQALSSLEVAADVMAFVVAHVNLPSVKKATSAQILAQLDLASCLRSSLGANYTSWVSTVTGIFKDCFNGTLLKQVFGGVVGVAIGSTVGTLAGIVNYFWTSGVALADIVRGKDFYTINIKPKVVPPPPPPTTPPSSAVHDFAVCLNSELSQVTTDPVSGVPIYRCNVNRASTSFAAPNQVNCTVGIRNAIGSSLQASILKDGQVVFTSPARTVTNNDWTQNVYYTVAVGTTFSPGSYSCVLTAGGTNLAAIQFNLF
jgi:hypothetical protein